MSRFLLILSVLSLAVFYCANRFFPEPAGKNEPPVNARYSKIQDSVFTDSLSLGFHYLNVASHYSKPVFQETRTSFIYREDEEIEEYYRSYMTSSDAELSDIGHFGIAMCYFEQGLYESSINHLVKVSRQEDPFYALAKGRIYLKSGMFTDAAETLREAMERGAPKELVIPHLLKVYYYSRQYDQMHSILSDSSNVKHFSRYMLSDVKFLAGDVGGYVENRVTPPSFDINFFAGALILLVWFFFLVQLNIFKNNNWAGYILIFILGTGFSYLCFPLYDLFELVFGFTRNGKVINDFLFCIFGIGFIEELVKIVPFLLVLRFTGFIKEPIDYMIYASISALGFAFAENLGYLSREGIEVIRGRALTATVTHMFLSSLIAYGLVLAKFRYQKSQLGYFMLFFGFSAFCHGFYDFWLINDVVSGYWLITLLFMLAFLLFWITFLNNALNNSPFFTYSKNVNSLLLKKYLTGGVIGVVMFQYTLSAWQEGAARANMELSVSLISTAFFAFFYASNFSYFDLVKSHWAPVNFHRFAWKSWHNRVIGKQLYLEAIKEGALSSLFPMRVEVIGRKVIEKEIDFYIIRLEKPVTIREVQIQELLLQTADRSEIQEDEENLVLILMPDEPASGETLTKKDLKLVAKAFASLEKE